MRFAVIACIACLGSVTGFSLAQQQGAAPTPAAKAGLRDLSPLLEPIMAQHDIPGMSVAIVKGWDTVGLGVAGIRKANSQEKVTTRDKFHLGSDTKAMTATLCAMLIEEGRLRWDSTLADVFPDLAPKMDAGYRAVTLEQLLTNHAGAPGGLDRDGLWGKLGRFSGSPVEARQLLLEGVTKFPPDPTPGTKFVYSNAGYAIAGHMAEKITGTPWEDLLRDKLFKPLHMDSAGFGAPGSKGAIDQPRGHDENSNPVEPGIRADNPVAIGPAGIVHCTVEDWAKFIALHLRGDQGDAKLLKPETFKKLHTPFPDPDEKYACGWGVKSRPWAGEGERVLTHSGSNTLWYCVVWIAPEKDFAVLVACNKGGSDAAKACDEASWALIQDQLKQK